jgi:hypothetical protein
MLIEAAKGAVILAILERLFLTRHSHWVRQPPNASSPRWHRR